MAPKRITYGDIRHLLEAEGFQRMLVPGSHVQYEHAPAESTLLLPIHKANAVASAIHLAMVKGALVDFGIMTESDFDRWITNPKRFQAA